ncbi:type I-MYXAN CRISPR-associated protein Cas6/Cmx6 [Nostoc sp. PCC 7524]|uniref:type I-MYXAN CRISPR-associated protein Cas6/Cmx6 n=1 Tax=Nostoc sp. (strain ATCC 29411 / PCC 7524) TaxID=28072 RepID=UPI003FA3BC99
MAGKSLRIGKHTIRLGIPDICLLQPAEKLRSRIVVIRGHEEPETLFSRSAASARTTGYLSNC